MKVAIYARISTDDKDQNVDSQLLFLRKICDAHGYEIVKEYTDEHSGRKIAKREGYQSMMKSASRKSFDAIVVYKLDRLHRNVREQLYMADKLKVYDVNLISVTESIDTTTAIGRMFFVICAALAECESDKTSERVKIGMARVKAEGKLYHRPRKVISNSEIERARRILKQNPVISQRELALHFEGISRPTLVRALKEKGVLK